MIWLLIIIIAILLLGPELIWGLILLTLFAGIALIALGVVIWALYNHWQLILFLTVVLGGFCAVFYGIERGLAKWREKHPL